MHDKIKINFHWSPFIMVYSIVNCNDIILKLKRKGSTKQYYRMTLNQMIIYIKYHERKLKTNKKHLNLKYHTSGSKRGKAQRFKQLKLNSPCYLHWIRNEFFLGETIKS